MEKWKEIEGYTDYMVSNLGNVKSLNYNRTGKEKILKPKYNNGYYIIGLRKNGKQNFYLIHRLVAEAFIQNTDNKQFIDHINTDRSDNRVENLRWVTHKENCNNPLSINKWKGKNNHQAKSILQFDKNMNFVRKWECGMDIVRELGINCGNISSCCNGRKTKAGGFIWGFESDYERIHFNVFDLEIYKKKVA